MGCGLYGCAPLLAATEKWRGTSRAFCPRDRQAPARIEAQQRNETEAFSRQKYDWYEPSAPPLPRWSSSARPRRAPRIHLPVPTPHRSVRIEWRVSAALATNRRPTTTSNRRMTPPFPASSACAALRHVNASGAGEARRRVRAMERLSVSPIRSRTRDRDRKTRGLRRPPCQKGRGRMAGMVALKRLMATMREVRTKRMLETMALTGLMAMMRGMRMMQTMIIEVMSLTEQCRKVGFCGQAHVSPRS